ncbi:DUF2771 domain-containing protein [Rhodococcus sp. 27YEA15]|uniref:DUF2771 domain-containing protein n=1 Tax=Rhodococcus sp. 27YEA15 TaxID=3156259 RepID=UPI003C7C9CAB
MRSRTKKIVAAVSVLMVVALLAYGSVLVLIVKGINDRPESLPKITAYAHGKTIEIEPAGYCTIDLSQCAQVGDISELDVPAGYPLQLSLSNDVSSERWALLAVYEDADGNQTGEPRLFEADEAKAVTVESSKDPLKQLVGVEIHLAVSNNQGVLIWSVKTA